MTEKISPFDRKTIVLIGVMGCGKTVTGLSLSQKLNIRFVDSDKELELQEGLDINEIYSRFGKEYLLNCEQKKIKKILDTDIPQVVSIGASALLNKDISSIIYRETVSVFLKVNKATAWERVKRRNTRPILEHSENKEEAFLEYFSQILEFEKTSNIVVSIDSLNTGMIVDLVIQKLSDYINNYKELN